MHTDTTSSFAPLAPVLALLHRLGDMALFLVERCMADVPDASAVRQGVPTALHRRRSVHAGYFAVQRVHGAGPRLHAFTPCPCSEPGMLGSLISLTLIRELGPVLTAVMITARAGFGH